MALLEESTKFAHMVAPTAARSVSAWPSSFSRRMHTDCGQPPREVIMVEGMFAGHSAAAAGDLPVG